MFITLTRLDSGSRHERFVLHMRQVLRSPIRNNARCVQDSVPLINSHLVAFHPGHAENEIVCRIEERTKHRFTLSKYRNYAPKFIEIFGTSTRVAVANRVTIPLH